MAKRRENRRKSSLAFPYEPDSERGRFIRFMDEAGATQVFMDTFTALFNEPIKPEDPIEWIKRFLRNKSTESFTEVYGEMKQLRKNIIKVATEREKLISDFSEEEQLTYTADKIDEDSVYVSASTRQGGLKDRIISVDEKYVEQGGDSRWQIKPDPIFRAHWSKDEIAVKLEQTRKKQSVKSVVSGKRNVDKPPDLELKKAEISEEKSEPDIIIPDSKDVEVNAPPPEEVISEIPPELVDESTETSPQPSKSQLLLESEEEIGPETDEEEIEKPKSKKGKQKTLKHHKIKLKEQKPVQVPETRETDEKSVPSKQSSFHISEPGFHNTYSNCDDCITPSFWTNFSLGKVETQESDDEDDGLFYDNFQQRNMATTATGVSSDMNEILAKPYKPMKAEEFSWLPSILTQDFTFSLDEESQEKKAQQAMSHYKFEMKPHGVQTLRQIN